MFGGFGGLGRNRRPGADEPAPDSGKRPSTHYPYVRPLQTDWKATPTGFRATGKDAARFEVICAACGDLDGPTEFQPVPVQRLRGPYASAKAAERVARYHQHSTRPTRSEVRHDPNAMKLRDIFSGEYRIIERLRRPRTPMDRFNRDRSS